MNLAWIAGLAIYVALEKLLPLGPWLGRVVGAALIVLGVITVDGGMP
jgi:predicted metal-binding membrane protein